MPGLAVEKGDIEPIVVDTRRTGQAVTIRVFRTSDKRWLDWSDNTFKLIGAVVTLNQPLVAVDATNAPGLYSLASLGHPTGLNTGLLTNLTTTALEELVVIPAATPGAAGVRLEPGRIKVVPRIDGVVPERVVHSRTNAMAKGPVTLSGATPEPAQDAAYYDENGVLIFTNRNTGDQRQPV